MGLYQPIPILIRKEDIGRDFSHIHAFAGDWSANMQDYTPHTGLSNRTDRGFVEFCVIYSDRVNMEG